MSWMKAGICEKDPLGLACKSTFLEGGGLIAKDSTLCKFGVQANSTLYIFGVEPFMEDQFIDWNFVSSRKERIEEAKKKWADQTFDKIKGD